MVDIDDYRGLGDCRLQKHLDISEPFELGCTAQGEKSMACFKKLLPGPTPMRGFVGEQELNLRQAI